MDSREIRHRIRDLRSDLCCIQRKILAQIYFGNYDYYHPSIKPSLDKVFILELVIDGYVNLLNQATDIESETVLRIDVPKEKWFDK